MNFDLSEEQEMIVDAVQKFVSNDSPVERFRKLRDHEIGWEKSVWSAMGEYGWLGVEVPEELGGPLVHAQSAELHCDHAIVDVDDEPAEAVALRVDEPIARALLGRETEHLGP